MRQPATEAGGNVAAVSMAPKAEAAAAGGSWSAPA